MHPIFKLKDMYYNNVHHVLRFFFTVDFDSLCQFVFFFLCEPEHRMKCRHNFVVRDKTMIHCDMI